MIYPNPLEVRYEKVAGAPFLSGWVLDALLYCTMETLPLGLILSALTRSVLLIYAICLAFLIASAYLSCNSKRRNVK